MSRAALAAILTCLALPATAQDAPASEAEADATAADLARRLSNPVASLISVPFQQNLDFGLGADGDGARSTLNIQPVVPLSVGSDWNVIVRTILPVIYQVGVSSRGSSEFGLGDVTQSFFLSPKAPGRGGLIWGAGPVFLYPSATDRALGTEKWGAGPTFVGLKQSGQLTYGVLANHLWSVAGADSRSDLSATFIQPFFSFTTKKATTYAINSETTYDWKRDAWQIPVNVTVTQLTRMGTQPVSVGVGARYYLDSPQGGPDWGLRAIFTLLFPTR